MVASLHHHSQAVLAGLTSTVHIHGSSTFGLPHTTAPAFYDAFMYCSGLHSGIFEGTTPQSILGLSHATSIWIQ